MSSNNCFLQKYFTVESINISEKKGTPKHPVPDAKCIDDFGIKNDAHGGSGHRQVSLLAGEDIDNMRSKAGELQIKNGDFAENIVTRGIDWTQARLGGKIVIGTVVLEISQIGKECHSGCIISQTVGECIMPKLGIFTRVIEGGTIHAGDSGYYRFR